MLGLSLLSRRGIVSREHYSDVKAFCIGDPLETTMPPLLPPHSSTLNTQNYTKTFERFQVKEIRGNYDI